MGKNYYCCPKCKQSLFIENNAYLCTGCKARYVVENGVVNFRNDDFYWGVLEQDMLKKLIAFAEKQGWEKAVEEHLEKENPGLCEYLLNPARSYAHLLMPIPRASRVLDLGCGWGTLSFPLAKEYDRVFAVDSTKEKVQFINIRARQSKINNISPVYADALNLPFEDNYFDLIVVYGVLEWMGLSGGKKRPEFYQLALLKEARRVLKKGGYLYLAIENRWGVVYFLGHPDPHTGLRFVTLMPRFLADIYSKAVRKNPYRSYTHSLKNYRKLFKQAGFSQIEAYSPIPSYRKFWYLLPLDNSRIMPYFLNYLSSASTPLSFFLLKLARLSRLYKLIKYFVPDYSFVIRK